MHNAYIATTYYDHTSQDAIWLTDIIDEGLPFVPIGADPVECIRRVLVLIAIDNV